MAALNHGFETGHSNITKISQVTPEVTLFLRNLGFSNYYIIKIFDLVGETAVALTEDNPYWLLDEFPRMGFHKVDEAAEKLGVSRDSEYRIESGIRFGLKSYVAEGHSYAPVQQLCRLHGRFIRSINKFGFAGIEKSTYKQGVLFHYTSEEQMQLKGLNYIMVVTHGFLQK